jgi:hypothetical protein
MTVTNVTPPTISGTFKVAQTVSSSDGTWTFDEDYLTYTYQWRRCDAAGANCSSISNATSNTYLVTAADVGSTLRCRVTATENVLPPDPAPGDELSWAPPTLSSPVVYTLTNSNRTQIPNGAGRDLRINQTEVLTGPCNQLYGWRHIEWIGGEFASTQVNATGHIMPRECTGTLHFEGIKFRQVGSASGDCFAIRADSAGGTIPVIQIQNCDLQVQTLQGVHSDIYQTQIARVGELRVDKCTITTNYQGFFIQNEPGYSNPAYHGPVTLRRVNFVAIGGASPAGSWFAKMLSGTNAFRNNLGPWLLDDVWCPNVGNPGTNIFPDTGFHDYIAGGTQKFGSFVRSDVDGTYIAFSTTSDTVPTGTYAGQAAANCQISGKLRVGNHPGGNFVASDAGNSYVSPGYV